MSKKETPAKAPEKKSAFQKAAAMAKQKQAEKKNDKNKEKVNVFQKLQRFFRDMKSEAKKIVWPSKKQIINNTGVVLAVIAICSLVLWPLDWALLQLFNLMF